MGTLGAVEQFLVKTRDIWSPDRSVCKRQDYNLVEVERKVSIIFFTQVALYKKFFRALFQRNTKNQKEALDKYHI